MSKTLAGIKADRVASDIIYVSILSAYHKNKVQKPHHMLDYVMSIISQY